MLPRVGSSKLVSRWILVTLGASIIAWLDGGWLATQLALVPLLVLRGQVWRLVTWPLVEGGPISLVLTCAAIYKLGGDLAIRWGDRRLRRFMLQIVIGASVATCIVCMLPGLEYFARIGGWVVDDVLVIAWARQFPRETLVIYQFLSLRGRDLIAVTIGVTILFAIYMGPIYMTPEIVACAAAAMYPRGWLRR